MGGGGLGHVHIAFGRHQDTRFALGSGVRNEEIAQMRAVFVAYPVRPVVQPDPQPIVFNDGLCDPDVITATQVFLIPILGVDACLSETVLERIPRLPQNGESNYENNSANQNFPPSNSPSDRSQGSA